MGSSKMSRRDFNKGVLIAASLALSERGGTAMIDLSQSRSASPLVHATPTDPQDTNPPPTLHSI